MMITLKEQCANYLLANRLNAILAAGLLAILPFCNWFSVIIIAFVTLQKGAAEGFIVMLWASLPAFVLAFFGHTLQWLLINNVLGGSLFVWLLACLFRKTHNWQYIVQISLLSGIGVVIGIHLYYSSLVDIWWIKQLQGTYQKIANSFALSQSYKTLFSQLPLQIAPFATGLKTTFALVADIAALLIARAWQRAYNKPQHVIENSTAKDIVGDWKNLRLSYPVFLFSIGIVAASVFSPMHELYKDILPVVLCPFLFAGISLIHYVLLTRQQSIRKLKFFYTLLIIFALILPYCALGLLILVSIADSLFNFRKRLSVSTV